VRVRLVDDARTITASDDETIGEIAVSGPNLFLGYLNPPDATAEVMRDDWFHTGDLATRGPRRLPAYRRPARHRPHQERRFQDRGR
jgi:malonyl-CoA/methylmalonyl-CoA synthetase